jgi:hypothetical protein
LAGNFSDDEKNFLSGVNGMKNLKIFAAVLATVILCATMGFAAETVVAEDGSVSADLVKGYLLGKNESYTPEDVEMIFRVILELTERDEDDKIKKDTLYKINGFFNESAKNIQNGKFVGAVEQIIEFLNRISVDSISSPRRRTRLPD